MPRQGWWWWWLWRLIEGFDWSHECPERPGWIWRSNFWRWSRRKRGRGSPGSDVRKWKWEKGMTLFYIKNDQVLKYILMRRTGRRHLNLNWTECCCDVENGRNLLCDENDDEDGRWLGLFGALASTANVIAMTSKNTTQQMHLATHYTALIIEMGQSVVWRRRNARRVRAKKLLSAAAYPPPPLLHQFCSSGSIFDQSQHRPYSPQKLVTKFSRTSMIPNMGGITSSWCENSLNPKEIDPWLLPAWPHASVWSQKLKKPVPL